MKKLFLLMCVCAGLCACSSDDDLVSSSSTSENLGEATAFLRVNLKDVNSSTRATDGGFKYGSTTEQTVNNAYFYFYGSDGHAMAKGSVVGGITGTASEETTTPGNIEWESGTVVAIWGLNEEHFPTQMLTILNKPADIDLSGLTLENATKVLAGTPYGNSDGTFVMSTSTYLGSNNTIVNTTALESTDFATEPIDLENDYPDGGVDVYVERLAAKVTANDGLSESDYTTVEVDGTSYSAVDITKNIPNIASSDIAGIAVRLVDWDVNGVARDAYLSKQIDAKWDTSTLWTSWNDASNYRSYWAESPNYGVAETETVYYPTSSNGNTDDDEADATTWLNPYLKYTSLASANAFGSGYAYCGENTNTTTVLVDDSNTGITNLLVRAQALTQDGEGAWHGSDLVEYQEKLYTAADFCQKSVEDVVAYDMNTLVNEVIAGLESSNETLAPYIEMLNNAIIHDGIWVGDSIADHKVTSRNIPTGYTVKLFDGSLLSLYNVKDGNVRMFYNMTTWPATGAGTTQDPFVTIQDGLMDKYPASDIVYPTTPANLGDYEFYFHIDATKIDATLENLASLLGLIVTIGDQSYLPIDNSFSFTSSNLGYQGHYGNQTYTLRNYFLRAITVEADDIDADFGSYYPNLYANGYMYYSVPIEHLNTPAQASSTLLEGEYGIVRNHWYDITVNSITTLGRGIAKPTEVIIPQPELTYYYLGADINILSWKMVNQTVGF